MNRKRLFLIGLLAVFVAALVTFGVYRQLRQVASLGQRNMVHVVVATNDLSVGTRLDAPDLRLAELPSSDLPEGTFQGVAEVIGRGVIVSIKKNEPILAAKLASTKAGAGLPSLIPPSKRALSVQVNEVISVAGFVGPGTHVDVLLTGRPSTGNQTDVMTTTVLQNVEVLAAGQELQQNPEGGKPRTVTVITLLVTPEEAEKLALASSEGRIQLALRNPMDVDQQAPAAVKSASLYSGVSKPLEVSVAPKHKPSTQAPAALLPPPQYVVEMIKGDKRDYTKF